MNIIGAVSQIQDSLPDEEIIIQYRVNEPGKCDMCSDCFSKKDNILIVNNGVNIIEVCCDCALSNKFTDADNVIGYFIDIQKSKLKMLERLVVGDTRAAYYMAHE